MTTEEVPGATPVVHFGQLSPESARSIDEICDCFEHQLYVQGRPRIEDLLGGFNEPERTILLRELLFLELETYLSRGTFADPERYRQRFPKHTQLVREVFEALFPSPTPTDAQAEQSWPEIPNYRILRQLNEGGMGRVYEAIHTRLGTPVAVKVLREDLASGPVAEARFEREMKVIGTLSHPNIVVARDAGRSAGRYYLVMEYVKGLDLAEVLEGLGTLPVPEACEIARRIALALQCAHEHRLVHRDIKPQNVLLGRCPPNLDEIQVKVADFGVALLPGYQALRDPAVRYAHVLGTFAYMAPEQYWEQRADIRSDIYSLGCTLYCLLLGRPPFGRPYYEDSLQIMVAHLEEPVPSFRKLRPDVPEPLEQIVLSAMAKDPNDRPQTPAELAASLAPFAEGHDLASLLSRAKLLPPLTPVSDLPGTTEPTQSFPSSAEVLVEEPSLQQTIDLEEDVGEIRQKPPAADRPDRGDAGRAGSPAPSSREGDEAQPAGPPPRGRWRRISCSISATATIISLAVVAALVVQLLSKPSPVDLLPAVQLDGDGRGKPWTLKQGELVSPEEPNATVTIPVSLPEEYDLQFEAECESVGKLVIGMVWQGQQIHADVGPKVRVGPAPPYPSQAVPNVAPEGGDSADAPPHTYVCRVRRDQVVVTYEGRTLFSWRPEEGPPPIAPDWQMADRDALWLGTDNSVYHFRKITLTPVH